MRGRLDACRHRVRAEAGFDHGYDRGRNESAIGRSECARDNRYLAHRHGYR